MAKINLNENKNQPIISDKDLPKFEGVKVLKVLRIVIDRDESFYNCVMEDGTIRPIPIGAFGDVKNEPSTTSPTEASEEESSDEEPLEE